MEITVTSKAEKVTVGYIVVCKYSCITNIRIRNSVLDIGEVFLAEDEDAGGIYNSSKVVHGNYGKSSS
jgi:hypothetical protein